MEEGEEDGGRGGLRKRRSEEDDKEEDVRMRKRMSRNTEKDEKEDEPSKCYFRNSFCSLRTNHEHLNSLSSAFLIEC